MISRMNKNPIPSFYNIAINKKKHADINIIGVIGWHVWINKFIYDLEEAGELSTIKVRINSIGGSFYDGLPIFNLLKEHPAHVTTCNIGYALSMGSVLLLAGDTIEMAENAILMIHRAQGFAWGDAKKFRKQAEILETHENASLMPIYTNRLNKNESEVLELLQDETWYTAKQAKDAGLIDVISNKVDLKKAQKSLKQKVGNQFENPAFNYHPPGFFQPSITALQSATPWYSRFFHHAESTQAEDDTMTPEQEERLISAIEQQGSDLSDAFIAALDAIKPKKPTEENQAEAAGEGNQNTELEQLKAKAEKLEQEKQSLQAKVNKLSKPAGQTTISPSAAPAETNKYDC